MPLKTVYGCTGISRSPSAQPGCRYDLLVRPAADPGLFVGRDVARVDRAERAVVAASPGVDRLLGHGVAAAAPGRPEDVLAPRELGGRGCLPERERGERSQRYQECESQMPGRACQDTHYWRTKVKSVSSWMSFETL